MCLTLQLVPHLPESHPPESMQPLQPLQSPANPSSLEVRQLKLFQKMMIQWQNPMGLKIFIFIKAFHFCTSVLTPCTDKSMSEWSCQTDRECSIAQYMAIQICKKKVQALSGMLWCLCLTSEDLSVISCLQVYSVWVAWQRCGPGCGGRHHCKQRRLHPACFWMCKLCGAYTI